MNKQQKAEIVNHLAKELKGKAFYIADTKGLNVAAVNNLRQHCYEASVRYQVVKNTLLKKALESIHSPLLQHQDLQQKILRHMSTLFIANPESASQPAKLIQAFHQETKHKQPLLKVAHVDGETFVGSEHLTALTQLKSKAQLIADLVQCLQASIYRVMDQLAAPQQALIDALEAHTKK